MEHMFASHVEEIIEYGLVGCEMRGGICTSSSIAKIAECLSGNGRYDSTRVHCLMVELLTLKSTSLVQTQFLDLGYSDGRYEHC